MNSASPQPCPLLFLTGFLGSGKTTLLRQLLEHLRSAGIRVHVILNDYANAALDSATLRDLAPDIIPTATAARKSSSSDRTWTRSNSPPGSMRACSRTPR